VSFQQPSCQTLLDLAVGRLVEPSSSSGLQISAEVSATAALLEGCAARLDLNATHQYKVRTIRFLKQFSIRVVPHVVDCTLGGHECANPRGGAPAPDVLSLDWARRRRPWCASVVSRTAGREEGLDRVSQLALLWMQEPGNVWPKASKYRLL